MRINLRLTEIAVETGRSGFCISPNFLDATSLEGLQKNFSQLRGDGAFARAAVGKGPSRSIRDSVRRDEICWLEPAATQNPAHEKLFAQLEELKTAFNRSLYLGLTELEIHYAAYPPGGFYQRHLDSFASDASRQVSLVIYLNENWHPDDGGELRIYNRETYLDVAPIGGTLVCFLSREIEHEVLESRADRKSLAGWFR